MRKQVQLLAIAVMVSNLLFAQSGNADKLEIIAPGSFSKPKIVPHASSMAIAQVTVTYKLASTAKTISKEKSSGSTAGARITAYLETTDGELTQDDFTELTNYFYGYLQKKLKENGVDTVAWSTIAATDFYKSGAEKMDLDPSDGYTVTAHGGNSLYGGGIAFAFGKIKKASRFCEEIGAPAGFLHLTLDFADAFINVDIKTTKEANMFYSKTTERKTFKWAVKPDMKVTPTTANTSSLFWNDKSQSESLAIREEISAETAYATNVTDDPSRLKSGFARMWAFRKEVSPVVIETTREQYKNAARKALEKFADAFVAKTKS